MTGWARPSYPVPSKRIVLVSFGHIPHFNLIAPLEAGRVSENNKWAKRACGQAWMFVELINEIAPDQQTRNRDRSF